jgi:hypothetical protein
MRTLGLVLTLAAATSANAQTLAARVARAADGEVRMEIPSRPGTCGDGRDVIGYRNALFTRNSQTIGIWSGVRCVAGPLRVTLTISEGEVTHLRTQVGGSWAGNDTRVTDFGLVAPAEASAFLFSLVTRLERASRKDRLLLAAVLADEAPVLQPLLALARDRERATSMRQHAIQWLGLLGDMSVVEPLMALARNDPEDDKNIGSAALMALSILDGEAGIRAAGWLIERALDERENLNLRKNALFWAGQREATATARLVRVYRDARVSELREQAIFVLSQRRDNEATEALLAIASEEQDTELRGKALFWLAQKDEPRVRKLIANIILRDP